MIVTDTRPQVPRDRWGRPLILPPEGGDRVAYTRATTIAGELDNRRTLENWLQRCVAVGLMNRPDLMALIASENPTVDDREIDHLVQQAAEAGKAHARANLGTALHRFAERVDMGEERVQVPAPYHQDLEAYKRATEGFTWCLIEELVLLDRFQIAGSPDRVGTSPDGRMVVADLKTGKGDQSGHLAYGWLGFAIQVAIYAHAQWVYHQATDTRAPFPEVDLESALIIHLPAGEGRCQLYDLDIAKGWRYFQTALEVREARADRKLWKLWDDPGQLVRQLAMSLPLGAEPGAGLALISVSDPAEAMEVAPATVTPIAEAPRAIARRVLGPRLDNPDEGPDADPAAVVALETAFKALPATQRAWVSELRRTALLVDINPGLLSLSKRASVKRFEIARALTRLCQLGMGQDETVSDLLLAVDPELAQPAIPLGAALAVLTVKESQYLASVVDTLPPNTEGDSHGASQ